MLVDRLDSVFGSVRTLRRVQEGVPTAPFFDEIFQSDGSIRFGRPSFEWPHREAQHIFLRSVPRSAFTSGATFFGNITQTVDTDLYAHYPNMRAWIDAFARMQGGEVERVVIAALAPHKQVYRHADRGFYYAPRDRYHLVIRSDGGAMRIAGQKEVMRQGEVWWINNKASHESFNDLDTVRVHLIVDLLPHSYWRRIQNWLRWLYLGLRPKRLTNYYFNWPRRFQATS